MRIMLISSLLHRRTPAGECSTLVKICCFSFIVFFRSLKRCVLIGSEEVIGAED
jgi:hypothetical protein